MKKSNEIVTPGDFDSVWAECMKDEQVTIKKNLCYIGAWELPNGDYLNVHEIDPLHNMSQCWMLVEKVNKMGMTFESAWFGNHDEFWAQIKTYEKNHSGKSWVYNEGADTPQKAIILVCALALGILEKEDEN